MKPTVNNTTTRKVQLDDAKIDSGANFSNCIIVPTSETSNIKTLSEEKQKLVTLV